MNLYGLCGCPAVRQCGSAAGPAAVCGNAHGSVRAVRALVCDSALSSVWQCERQCAAAQQCGSVQQCAAVCGSVQQCAAVCGSAAVQRCAAVRRCAAG
jgi:hypothetical protein